MSHDPSQSLAPFPLDESVICSGQVDWEREANDAEARGYTKDKKLSEAQAKVNALEKQVKFDYVAFTFASTFTSTFSSISSASTSMTLTSTPTKVAELTSEKDELSVLNKQHQLLVQDAVDEMEIKTARLVDLAEDRQRKVRRRSVKRGGWAGAGRVEGNDEQDEEEIEYKDRGAETGWTHFDPLTHASLYCLIVRVRRCWSWRVRWSKSSLRLRQMMALRSKS